MRIEIEKDWFEKNAQHFKEFGGNELSGEDKEYYVFDTKEDNFFKNYDEKDSFMDDDGLNVTSNNEGLYIRNEYTAKPEDIETIVEEGGVDITIKVIGVVTKKMNQIKSLLESAKAL